MKMEQTVFRNVGIQNSEPGNYPEENIQHSEHGESLKSRRRTMLCINRQTVSAVRTFTCDITTVENWLKSLFNVMCRVTGITFPQ
jgi:hypothetical protein